LDPAIKQDEQGSDRSWTRGNSSHLMFAEWKQQMFAKVEQQMKQQLEQQHKKAEEGMGKARMLYYFQGL